MSEKIEFTKQVSFTNVLYISLPKWVVDKLNIKKDDIVKINIEKVE